MTPTQDEIPLFLTAQQAARLLRVRQSKIVKWLRSGELAGADVSEKPGRGKPRWRISRAALESFLRKRQPHPPTERATRRRVTTNTGIIEFIK